MAGLAPGVIVVALITRPPPPSVPALPSPIGAAPEQRSVEHHRAVRDVDGVAVTVRVTREAQDSSAVVAISGSGPLLRPELLVYWHPGNGPVNLASARLLGRLGGNAFRAQVPDALDLPATVLLYSLGHDTVLLREAVPVMEGGSDGR